MVFLSSKYPVKFSLSDTVIERFTWILTRSFIRIKSDSNQLAIYQSTCPDRHGSGDTSVTTRTLKPGSWPFLTFEIAYFYPFSL